MSFNTNGFSGSPISASKVTGFFDATLEVLQEIGTLPGGGAGLLAVAITGGNLSGNGQSANPLYLNDLITVADVHTNNLSASNQVTASFLRVVNNINAGNINTLSVTSSFKGDGSQVTNLTASNIQNFTADTRAQLSAGANLNYSAGQFALNANVNTATVTSSFNGDGCKITNITASNIPNWSKDVRSQLSGNHYVTYNTGSGNISLTYTGSIVGTTPVILGQTSSVLTGLTNISSSTGNFNQVTSSFSGNYAGDGNVLINLTASGISNFTTDTRAQFSAGTNLNYSAGQFALNANVNTTSLTASLKGNGSQVTNITASNITNWTTDVRSQLSGSQYVTYNTSSGIISLPFTGSTIGTTPIILGQTTTSLAGLSYLSSSQILVANLTASNEMVVGVLSASQAIIGTLTSSLVTFGGINIQNSIIVQTPSAIQTVNSASIIQLASGIMKISSGVGSLTTLSSTPTITTSSVLEGTRITIINVGTGTIRFQTDTSFSGPNPATKLRLISTNQDIGLLQTIELVYISGSTGFFWAQIAKA